MNGTITGTPITRQYLRDLKPSYTKKGYPVPKWIVFSEIMINRGWEVFLYRARKTVSKYVWVKKGEETYKVRFSNHRANYKKENDSDCDYYVGVGNFGVITTEQAIDKICGVEDE